jgi:hypothetical protein
MSMVLKIISPMGIIFMAEATYPFIGRGILSPIVPNCAVYTAKEFEPTLTAHVEDVPILPVPGDTISPWGVGDVVSINTRESQKEGAKLKAIIAAQMAE